MSERHGSRLSRLFGRWRRGGGETRHAGGLEAGPEHLAALEGRVEMGVVDEGDVERAALEGAELDPAGRFPPLAADPRVGARTPSSQLMGYAGFQESGDPSRMHRRTHGVPLPGGDELRDSLGRSEATAERMHATTRPGEAPDALRWLDGVTRPVADAFDVELGQPPRAWELAALRGPPRSTTVLEQLATWAAVTPLDADGAPAGPRVVLSARATADDLAAGVFTHPNGATLRLSYTLRRDGEVDAPPAEAVPLHHLPATNANLGLPHAWQDQRFAWGGWYGKGLRCVVRGDGGVTLRLYMMASIEAGENERGQWRLEATGRLAGWSQLASTSGVALAAAKARD